MTRNRLNIILLLFLLLFLPVALAVYWPGLSGALMLDDGPQIMPVMNGINADNWTTEFKEYVLSNSGQLSRPVSMASFIFNAVFFGKDIWYWKLVNVVLHALCGLSVFLFTRLILSFDNRIEANKLDLISLTVAFFWLVHPLQVSTVLYLVQRMAILSALFIFAGLACFVYAVKKECRSEQGKFYLMASGLLFFPLAALSKESGILYPVFVLLINRYLRYQSPVYAGHVQENIKPFLMVMWLILFIGVAGFFYLFDNIITEGYRFRQFNVIQRLLTEPRVIFMYLYQILIPLPSHMGFFHDDIVISTGLFKPLTTVFSLIGLIFLIIAPLARFKKAALFAFGLLFFLLSHLLESTFLPLEIAFEHRNYIGIWGIILAVVYACFTHTKKAVYTVTVAGIVLCGLTLYTASKWSSPNKMYPFMLSAHPNSLRLKMIFADTYNNAGQYDEALEYLNGQNDLGVKLQRLDIECKKNKTLRKGELLATLTEADIKIGNYEMEGIINLANLGLDNICSFDKGEYIRFLNGVLLLPIVNKVAEQKILLYKAHYHHAVEQTAESFTALELSFAKDKLNPIPLFLMIDWLIEKKRYDEAEKVFISARNAAAKSWYDYTDFIKNANSALSRRKPD